MAYNKYKTMLQNFVGISPDAWRHFKSITNITKHSKGTIIHRAGTVNRNFYYINQGLVRAYLIDINGNDITWDFHFNDETAAFYNTFLIDHSSFPDQGLSTINFEVLEDCQLIVVSHQAIQFTYDHLENGERASRILAEKNSVYFQNRVLDRYTKTATQRYLDFTKKYPKLLGRVKHSYIASYLGITPESLSRIRKSLNN